MDYGLTPEQEEGLDGAVPGWRDMTPAELREAVNAWMDEILDLMNGLKELEERDA